MDESKRIDEVIDNITSKMNNLDYNTKKLIIIKLIEFGYHNILHSSSNGTRVKLRLLPLDVLEEINNIIEEQSNKNSHNI